VSDGRIKEANISLGFVKDSKKQNNDIPDKLKIKGNAK